MKKLITVVCIIIFPFVAFGGNSDGFFTSNISPSSPLSLKINGFVFNGGVYDFDMVWAGNTLEIQNPVINSCFLKAPIEQWENIRYAQTVYSFPPQGYTSVIGWVVGVNDGSGDGSVILKSLKVYGKDPQGIKHLISDRIICSSCTKPEDKVFGFHIPRSQWQNPNAWLNNPNNATAFDVLSDGSVSIPTSRYPSDVFHLWNTEWPRSTVVSGWTYSVEAEVLPQGSGMIQIGLDFYTDSGVVLEAAISNWNCSTPNSITVTAGF
ncbi:MAG: hypothetical protein WCJ49_00050 [Deltaproteobacteria bacterium]